MKIIFTTHAIMRCRERDVNGVYVRTQLNFIPINQGVHKWYIPKTELFVTYRDFKNGTRLIITIGKNDSDYQTNLKELNQ